MDKLTSEGGLLGKLTKMVGSERAAERPGLTVQQVFDLAERVGRRPIGNARKLPEGSHTAP